MNISAASDYGIRAALHLAEKYLEDADHLSTTVEISTAQAIPFKYLENLIRMLKSHGLVESKRGANGGHKLAKHPKEITLAEIIRAIDGPLAAVRGERPEKVRYKGSAQHLTEVWVAVRSSLRAILEDVTLFDVLAGDFSAHVKKSLTKAGAWERRAHLK